MDVSKVASTVEKMAVLMAALRDEKSVVLKVVLKVVKMVATMVATMANKMAALKVLWLVAW